MRACVAALALFGLLACAGPAAADLAVGVNDDAARDPDLTSWFFPTLKSVGLQNVAVTLRWDDTEPTAIPKEAAVEAAVSRARDSRVAVQLVLYPLRSAAFTGGVRCAPSPDPEACGDAERIQQFATWTARVARAFPSVRQFVVMNECNQPLFVNPQWNASGANTS